MCVCVENRCHPNHNSISCMLLDEVKYIFVWKVLRGALDLVTVSWISGTVRVVKVESISTVSCEG